MILRYTIFIITLLASAFDITAQQALRKLPYNINKPSQSISHPFISGDGESMVYLSNYSDDGSLIMYWTRKNGSQWMDGQEINRLVNRPTLNLQGAFSLNYEGDFLIVTSRKTGLGGYELWYSELKNGDWTELKNFGAPINSRSNEGGGVLTSDGKGMYFMRCEQMSPGETNGCQLYYSEKKYGRWQEPQLLPANINTYQPQMPRILADSETLIFSSKASGGKGGYDLYVTRKNDAGWDDPVSLSFANTAGDDRFVSVPAKGRYLYKAQMGDRNMEIVQVLFPEDLKPKGVYRVRGHIKGDDGTPVIASLKVFDINNRKRLIDDKTGPDGSFSFVLVEGQSYDVSLEPQDGGLQYFAKIYELEEIPVRDLETLEISVGPHQLGSPIANNNISFEPHEASVSEKSIFEIRRIAAVMRANPELNLKITSHLFDYREDSIASEDLTEVKVDTIWQPVTSIIPSDYLATSINDTIQLDSLKTNGAYFPGETDTLMVMVEPDSIHMRNASFSVSLPANEFLPQNIYHNDRTEKEAEAIKALLIDHGVESEKILTEGKVHAPEILAEDQKSRLVEITFFN